MIKPKVDLNRFEEEVVILENRDEPNGAIVFYGSSTFTFWGHDKLKQDMSPIVVVNCGFGGSTAHDALYYYDRLIAPIKPSKIVWYEGDNDIASGYTTNEIMEISKLVWDKLRADFPGIEIIVLSVKKSIARQEFWEQIKEVNEAYINYAKKVDYIKVLDHNTITIDEKGNAVEEVYVEDMLHFNEKGYKKLKKLIKDSI